jgi:hypothetical protein
MKILKYLFGTLHVVGYGGLTLLFLWVEWLYISNNWVQFFNPFLHLEVLWYMIKQPLTWILLVLSAVGYFATIGADTVSKDMQS